MDAPLLEARRLVAAGATRAERSTLRRAIELLDALLRDAPDSVWGHYFAAYARYRLAALELGNKQQAAGLLTAACDHLSAATRLDPENAEALALLSSCYGLRIRFAPYKSLWLGERKSQAMAGALRLAPENPRVVLLRALQLFTEPAFVGGDREEARAGFRRAVELFRAAEAPAPPAPDWGHPQALAFLGLACLKSGDRVDARAAFEDALALAPDYHWVKHVLLPHLEAADV
jgi:tetratricopeptide (TPR) repeat protein